MTGTMLASRRGIAALLMVVLTAVGASAHPHILRAGDRGEVSPEELIRDLKTVRVVFVGELHDHTGHHQAQLSIIRALKRASQPLAIGLEMFRKDSQAALDQWVSGTYPLSSFLKVYEDNWSMWEEYREIFTYARSQKIPMVGLNIPRELSSKVARNGFAALPEKERQALGNVRCAVSPEYSDHIRRAMGGHGGHGQQFLFFCEAQILWDTMMAHHLADYLKANPASRVVVLSGSSHSWKFGMPRQLLEQMEVTYRVVLPEVDGRINRNELDRELTDYLWLDVGEDGWAF
jgi:uncharacterized iron-regulated protein